MSDDGIELMRIVIAQERQQLAQGICPRTGKRFMPGGNLRPACAICDCGETDPTPAPPARATQHSEETTK